MEFYTLNQVLNLIETIANSHAQVNYYSFGEDAEISASEQERYPLVWSDVKDSNIDSNTLSLTIELKVLDIVKTDNTNEKDVLSDTLSIAQDIYSILTSYAYQDYFILQTATPLIPIREAMPDIVNGWTMTLSFQLMQDRNRCQVPLK
jgi:hypothetical protein